ncbi:hypothetical protein QP175_19410 [Sphingomonas aerolata]
MGNGDGGAGDQADSFVCIDAFAADIGIRDTGQPGNLRRDRLARILEPLPDLTDPHDHATGIESDALNGQIDDRVVQVETDRLDIDHHSGADQSLRFNDGIIGR